MIIVYIIIILLAIPFIAAIFQKDEALAQNEIVINASKQKVFDYIKYLKNGENYNKWVMADPNMKKDMRGTDGTIGFVYAWDSTNNNVGKGEQEIIKLDDGQRVECEVRFERPWNGVSYGTLVTEAVSPDKTKINWTFRGKKNYGMKVAHVVLNLEKKLGKDIGESLNNLKAILEK